MAYLDERNEPLNLKVGGLRMAPLLAGDTKTLLPTEAGRTVVLNGASGSTVTLPAATGSGLKWDFVVGVAVASHVIKVASASDIIQGLILGMTDNSAAVLGYRSADDSDTITLNATTMGGCERGERLVLEDIASGVWAVSGNVSQTGSEASPFSAGV
jgi:hypothetical protein